MKRLNSVTEINQAFKVHPVVAILGPRQCGKTTLARMYIAGQNAHYFDLEKPSDLARLENPELGLGSLSGLIVIDEIQRRPELFPILRVLVDEPNNNKQFLILGSASRELIRQSSESLAGRIEYIELTPFSFNETHELQKLWLLGGFPKSYLAENEENSYQWREAYIKTFLEQDIPNLGFNIPSQTLRRFWAMLSHYHANLFNASEIGKSLGQSDTTIKKYLDILVGTFMVRQLSPWFSNLKKRQVKTPKIYLRDSGILHTLLDIPNQQSLQKHPKLGSSWEGFALEEVIRALKVSSEDCYFWGTHSGAELDLLVLRRGKKLGFEFKYSDAPSLTKSMNIAREDLQLDSLTVIYPGKTDYLLAKDINVMGLGSYLRSISKNLE